MAGTSFYGINWAAFGIVDSSTGLIIADENKGLSKGGVVLVDGDGQGATTANITGLEAAGTKQYANNKAKRVTHGAQSPQLALTMLDMPFEYGQKMKGYVSDGKGGYVLKGGNKPNVAILLCVSDFWGNAMYEAFANGELIEAAHNHGTNTNNEVDYNSAYTYSALSPIKNDVFVDPVTGVQQPYKQFNSADTNFSMDAMLSEVFGGYKDDGTFAGHGKITSSTTTPVNQPANTQTPTATNQATGAGATTVQ